MATALFWQHGYDGTSIAMLTAALGCTPPTIYAAFGSKEGLYRDVVEQYRRRGPASQGERPATPSAYAMVERYLREVARQFTDSSHPKGCMVGTGALQCGPGSEAIASYAKTVRTDGHRLFAAKIEDAKSRGELPGETDVEAITRFYIAVVQGMSVQAIDGADRDQLEALVEIALTAWPGRRS
ncbi:TetR/AcrR family transcriptional regulator [Sphingomonas immobilis]|uniref:TetR/AcrR family transcriptional regulator n=1 Tax=Sphingomonas immobilis TaxID=3063997 RepID=A0ABT9A343_9SPHN|nr:TetR/AcrR family transcriptional regulator [Sphingomonas sp. CA1-15]MDO7843157.1 TetR/AcrR family transcriptional regulator [Sphingomonas sp. CA1-15]